MMSTGYIDSISSRCDAVFGLAEASQKPLKFYRATRTFEKGEFGGGRTSGGK
jgi:hypothetical protein